MVDCAHPTDFQAVLEAAAPWQERIRGVRANASARSHAELDEGDPGDLGARYAALRGRLPALNVRGAAAGPSTGTSPPSDAWLAASAVARQASQPAGPSPARDRAPERANRGGADELATAGSPAATVRLRPLRLAS